MIGATVRWLAIFASAFVVLGFLFFATDQTSSASQNQVRAIGGKQGVELKSVTKVPNPEPEVEELRELENDGFHEFVDDVNDILLAPFTGIYDEDNIWLRRIVPGGIALLLYGLFGLYLARAAGMRRW